MASFCFCCCIIYFSDSDKELNFGYNNTKLANLIDIFYQPFQFEEIDEAFGFLPNKVNILDKI